MLDTAVLENRRGSSVLGNNFPSSRSPDSEEIFHSLIAQLYPDNNARLLVYYRSWNRSTERSWKRVCCDPNVNRTYSYSHRVCKSIPRVERIGTRGGWSLLDLQLLSGSGMKPNSYTCLGSISVTDYRIVSPRNRENRDWPFPSVVTVQMSTKPSRDPGTRVNRSLVKSTGTRGTHWYSIYNPCPTLIFKSGVVD